MKLWDSNEKAFKQCKPFLNKYCSHKIKSKENK